MPDLFKPGDRDYVQKLNQLWQQFQAAGNPANPVFQTLAVAGQGIVANIFKITNSGGAQFLLMGNQDSEGTNNPSVITAANGQLAFGNGTSWSGSGGVISQYAQFSKTGIAFTPSLTAGGVIYANAGVSTTVVNANTSLNAPVLNLMQGVNVFNDAGQFTFYSSIGSVRVGYMQGSAGEAMTLMADVNTPELRFGTRGITRVRIGDGGWVMPTADNAQNLGWGNARWANAYVGTIISTSDARKKTAVKPMTDAMRAAARDLRDSIGVYQWLDAVKEKGPDLARWHVGMTVQQAIAILEKHGINPFSLGFICHDKWPAEYERRQINIGEKIIKHRDVVQQKTIEHERDHEVIEIVDGKPVLVSKPVKIQEPVFVDVPVSRPDGSLVMLETGQPMTVRMPELETVPEQYEVDADPVYEDVLIRPAGDCYSFRYDELNLFILAGVGQ